MSDVLSWLESLLPASFRGASFFVSEHTRSGGRRTSVQEFPLRDTPWTEDLGRKAKGFRITGYVIGDSYFADRDALLSACEDFNTPGTLIHPYLGLQTVCCTDVRLSETQERGRIASFEMSFVEAGTQPSPTSLTDTASALLEGIASLASIITDAFTASYAITPNAAFLQGQAAILLGAAGTSAFTALAGLAGSVLDDVQPGFTSFPAETADATMIAETVLGGFQDAAVAIVATFPSAPPADDPVAGTLPVPALRADPSYGLATSASWGTTLTPVNPATPLRVQQAANQAAIVSLVQGAAVLATAQVYAETDWSNASAASAARSQLFDLIDTQAVAAADAGQDALYAAWQGVSALMMQDFIQRAQALPDLGPYATQSSLPALALAQRIYADASQADGLVALNAAPHPLFMPLAGMALAA